jgi:chorismate mutase
MVVELCRRPVHSLAMAQAERGDGAESERGRSTGVESAALDEVVAQLLQTQRDLSKAPEDDGDDASGAEAMHAVLGRLSDACTSLLKERASLVEELGEAKKQVAELEAENQRLREGGEQGGRVAELMQQNRWLEDALTAEQSVRLELEVEAREAERLGTRVEALERENAVLRMRSRG